MQRVAAALINLISGFGTNFSNKDIVYFDHISKFYFNSFDIKLKIHYIIHQTKIFYISSLLEEFVTV